MRLIGVDGLKTLQEEWRVFVIMETPFKTEINLKEGSFVLHEVKGMHEHMIFVLTLRTNAL